MKILIIEDEIPAAEKLIKLLVSLDAGIEVLEVCRTVKSSVAWLKNNPAPNLILMDIELADGKSLEIFEQVTISSHVIFITAYNQYAINAIKLHALDYLLKPVTKNTLSESIKKVREHKNTASNSEQFADLQKLIRDLSEGKHPKKIAVHSRDSIAFINTDSILRLEAASNYTHLFLTGGKKITASRTLKEYEEVLVDHGFIRVHNAHIVNIAFIEKYFRGEGGHVLLTDGMTIEVSQQRKKELIDRLILKK